MLFLCKFTDYALNLEIAENNIYNKDKICLSNILILFLFEFFICLHLLFYSESFAFTVMSLLSDTTGRKAK